MESVLENIVTVVSDDYSTIRKNHYSAGQSKWFDLPNISTILFSSDLHISFS